MPAKKAVSKKAAKKTPAKKPVAKKPIAKKVPTFEAKVEVDLKECEHCDGIGKCTAGEPYDKGHHQMFGARVMLTSCFDCLEAAGEHRNSKKIVQCRICGGTGKVSA